MTLPEFSPSSPSLPLCTRLPRSGEKEPYSGLGRTQLDLIVRPQPGNNFDPPVRSHVLAARGNARGVRLIDVKSLLAYISSLPGEQPSKKARAKRRRAK
jgi:hypothetical protein